MVEGLLILKNVNVACYGCALGKMHGDEFPSNPDKEKRDVLYLVHSDVFGPMQTRSLGGAFYFLLFIDYCMRYTWVYFLREKMIFSCTLRNSKPWWKRRQENPSKSFIQIKGESINEVTSSNIAKIME
jgi:hypothetical protein